MLQFLLLYKFLMLYLSFFKLSVTISEEKIYLIAKIYLWKFLYFEMPLFFHPRQTLKRVENSVFT